MIDVSATLVIFGLVLARVGAFVTGCPVFVPDNVSPTLRAGLAGMLALCLTPAIAHVPAVDNVIMAVTAEVFIGAVFATSIRLVAVAISFTGEMFDMQLGFTFARVLNPMMSEETSPIMHLGQMLGGVMFLLAGGQHRVVQGLAASFRHFPPGSAGFDPDWVPLLCGHMTDIVQDGLLMAMPIVLAMMCTQLALALLTRLAPSLHVWAIGLLGTCGMGLIAIWCFMPAWLGAIDSMWRAPQAWLFEAAS